jgi:hypothetical protein
MVMRKTEPRRFSPAKMILGAVLLVAVLIGGFAVYILATLNVSYSDGERSGMLQKFSRKGWICKTWEGELSVSYMPGMAPVIWNFSVRDPTVVSRVNDVLGKKVVLHYEEHRGVPTDCFGETSYFVDNARVVE